MNMANAKAKAPKAKSYSLDDLTMGEAEDIEEAFGCPVSSMIDEKGNASMKLMRGIMWAVRRRDEPDLELDDLKSMTFTELGEAMGGGGPVGLPTPTAAAG